MSHSSMAQRHRGGVARAEYARRKACFDHRAGIRRLLAPTITRPAAGYSPGSRHRADLHAQVARFEQSDGQQRGPVFGPARGFSGKASLRSGRGTQRQNRRMRPAVT